MEAGLKKYKPDIIISVHPLMQHIPLWVLKWQGLQNRVVFVTVITDLNTCHPTWYAQLIDEPFHHKHSWSCSIVVIWNFRANALCCKLQFIEETNFLQVPHWCQQMLLPFRGSFQEGIAGWPRAFSNSSVWFANPTILLSCSSSQGLPSTIYYV